MLASITWRQFLEWWMYAELEPFSEEREDLRNAYIVTTMANLNRKKGKKPFQIADLVLPFGDTPKRRQSWQEQKRIGRQWFMVFGGR